MLLPVFVCVLFAALANGAIPAHLKAQLEAVKSGELVHGDIKLTEQQKLMRAFPANVHQKLFFTDFSQRWPGSIVPVSFSSKLTKENRNKIRIGLKAIEERTCFRFPEKKPDTKDYIKFEFDPCPTNDCPCWSRLGKTGGEQLISLVQGCIDDPIGTVGHEVFHALGAEHEHQRPDRDDYIDVEPSWADRNGYEKLHTNIDLSRFPYDTKSIMHYEGFQMWENGKLIKMLYIKGTDTPVARNKVLSDEDVRKLNELGSCSANSRSKQNGGNKRSGRKPAKKPAKKRRQNRG